ncbi:MAG: HAD hydrolase-like protein [Clostridia bacterium]
MQYDIAIFDLDGTLLDTSPGIFNCIRHTEAEMGLPPLDQKKYELFLGPPLFESYKRIYGLGEKEAMAAVRCYREYGSSKGIYEAAVFEGIEDCLQAIKAKGMKLAVATLKSQVLAEKSLQYFSLHHYFDAIVGMNRAESLTKADTIRIALEKVERKKSEKVVMIGDSEYDATGAAEAGVDFIWVTYGFGFKPGDKQKLPYRYMVSTPMDLLDIL